MFLIKIWDDDLKYDTEQSFLFEKYFYELIFIKFTNSFIIYKKKKIYFIFMYIF